jgi:hypothetical protein
MGKHDYLQTTNIPEEERWKILYSLGSHYCNDTRSLLMLIRQLVEQQLSEADLTQFQKWMVKALEGIDNVDDLIQQIRPPAIKPPTISKHDKFV